MVKKYSDFFTLRQKKLSLAELFQEVGIRRLATFICLVAVKSQTSEKKQLPSYEGGKINAVDEQHEGSVQVTDT